MSRREDNFTTTVDAAAAFARQQAEPDDRRPSLAEEADTGIGGYVFPDHDHAARFSLWGAIVPQDEPPF